MFLSDRTVRNTRMLDSGCGTLSPSTLGETMRASHKPHRGRTAPLAALLACAAAATPLRPAAAQTYAQQTTAAADYIAVHADREDMVRMPMRDGVRLSATILIPKDRPRQNLPTVLLV